MSQPIIPTANIIANFICFHVTYTALTQEERKNVKDHVEAFLFKLIGRISIFLRATSIDIF